MSLALSGDLSPAVGRVSRLGRGLSGDCRLQEHRRILTVDGLSFFFFIFDKMQLTFQISPWSLANLSPAQNATPVGTVLRVFWSSRWEPKITDQQKMELPVRKGRPLVGCYEHWLIPVEEWRTKIPKLPTVCEFSRLDCCEGLRRVSSPLRSILAWRLEIERYDNQIDICTHQHRQYRLDVGIGKCALLATTGIVPRPGSSP